MADFSTTPQGAKMNLQKLSSQIQIIRDACAEQERLIEKEQTKTDAPPLVPYKSLVAVQEAFEHCERMIRAQSSPGLVDQFKRTEKDNALHSERRVWQQIADAIRKKDEAEARKLAKAAGISANFLGS